LFFIAGAISRCRKLFIFFLGEGIAMAQISLSPLVVDIRGKQKDTVFSKWRGQNYIRSRVTPSNPQSGAQTAVRDALKEMVAAWKLMAALTIDTISGTAYKAGQAFNYAATGQMYSGFNLFMKNNRATFQSAQTVDFAPAGATMALPTISAATGSGASKTVALTVTPTSLGSHQKLVVAIQDETASTKPVVDVQLLTPSASPITVTCPLAGNSYKFHVFTVDLTLKTWSAQATSTATSHA
jgi:hypothetical protein